MEFEFFSFCSTILFALSLVMNLLGEWRSMGYILLFPIMYEIKR